MGRIGKARLHLKNGSYVILNRYFIPAYLQNEYCKGGAVIEDSDGIVEVFNSTSCHGCGRLFEEATKPTRICCNHAPSNHAFGYVLIICIDCHWYIQGKKGQVIPDSITKKIQQGFRPTKIWEYLSD